MTATILLAAAPFATTDDVRELVAAFESCTLPKEEFTHTAHLTVVRRGPAAWVEPDRRPLHEN